MAAKRKVCKCGCGRSFVDPARSRSYYRPSCRPSYKAKVAVKDRVCSCGCGKTFTPNRPNHLYADISCKREAEKIRSHRRNVTGLPKTIKKLKPFRETVCTKRGPFGINICSRYDSCSESIFGDGEWEYEKNGGSDCFVPKQSADPKLSYSTVINK